MSRTLALLALTILSTLPASAQKKEPEKKDAPTLLYTIPLVITPGVKQKLALRGKNLDAVKEVKVAGVGGATVKLLAARKTPVGNNQPGERIGVTEVEIELELPKAAKPGATLTAVGPGGTSAAYTLLIPDDTPSVKEKEPNDGFDAAQPVPVPSAVDATIKGERDTDTFRFDGKKGDRIRIEVQAARFGSPVDALLMVHDADRRTVAAADDTAGSPDPVVTLTLPRDGPFYVTVLDSNDLGGSTFVYRLVVKKGE